MQVRVRSITFEGAGILAFELVDPAGLTLPPFTAGSHIDVHLPGGMVRQYSLCNDSRDRHRYMIGVLRVAAGRGGSMAMHETVRAGDMLTISEPRNNFGLSATAERHLLLAGGIGVTPMMAMVEELSVRKARFELIYCSRSAGVTAFRDRLAPHSDTGRVRFHHDEGDPARALDLNALLAEHEPGTHLYCCGPQGLMNAVKAATSHWPSGTVHFEFFSAPAAPPRKADVVDAASGSFKVRLASSGQTYLVPPTQSIVEVLRANGVECNTSCEAGICGTCRTRYLDGEPEHNDFVLSDEEHAEFVLICCARSRSALLVLDR